MTTPPVPTRSCLRSRRAVIVLVLAAALPLSAVEPAKFSWAQGDPGNWSVGTNWTNDQNDGTAPAADGKTSYELTFGARGAFTATNDLNAGFLLNRLVFAGSEATLDGKPIRFTANGSALPQILQQGKGRAAVRIEMPISLLADLIFGGSGSPEVIVAGPISGVGGVTMAGSGLVSLEGANQYSGDTRVVSGTLRLAQANPFNDRATVSIAAGATLELAFTGTETVGALLLDGVARPPGLYGASNSGGAIKGAGMLQVVPPPSSSDPGLAALVVEAATLSPAFQPAVGAYVASVPNTSTSTRITPTAVSDGASVFVNGLPVNSGSPSNPIPLAVGSNLVTVAVTAPDGVTSRVYTVNVSRASAATIATDPAVVIDASRATLNGSANPGGLATVFFEWGPTGAYGNRTPDRDISGILSRAYAASLDGLNGATTYHYRAVLVDAAGEIYGENHTFTTPPNPPVVATGAPSKVTVSTASFVGAVNPNGVRASAYFEYGLTTAYGKATPVQSVAAGFGLVTVQAPDVPLIPGAVYNCRLVASNAAGTVFGDNVVFTVREGGGTGTGVPTGPPDVLTGATTTVSTESVILEGTVNPNSGTTVFRFEYGPTPDYGSVTPIQGIGNGSTPAAVAVPVSGLLSGATYHYRLTATNNLGTTNGLDAVFTTEQPPPTVVTGGSTALTTTSVRVEGTARARGGVAEIWFDYGTDGLSFDSVQAVPASISGDVVTTVSAELTELAQGLTHYYRIRAIGPGGQSVGEVRSFDVASLSGLIRRFPPGVPPEDRLGSVEVTLEPAGIGTGWRFAGEQLWRDSLVPATGLTAGDRVIEFRPVPGYLRPANEVVTVESSTATTPLTRIYQVSSVPGSGSLTVYLKPQNLTDDLAPARWRFFGENETAWRESGTTVDGLATGDYVILCKPVEGRSTPPPVTASVAEGGASSITITYYIAEDPIGIPPAVIGFGTVSGDTSLPNAYVGQLRSDAGAASGAVVRPQVIVTVGHAIFDDGTLAITSGLQWLFQRDRGTHDPVPVIPRGHYLLSGYAAQRIADNTPGESTPESQNLDVATVFTTEPAGRGGFSGYLASDNQTNEFLVSDALMTLVGYPVDGIPATDLGRMHATPPAAVSFTKAFDRTYTTSDIRASGGVSGGPVCVRASNGAYYPAAVYLGGTGQTVVRSFDGDVVELIGLAEASAGDGVGVIGGGAISVTSESYEVADKGGLRVVIEPESARAAGAGWRISNFSPYLPSGGQLDNLPPGTVQVAFPSLEGFVPPAPQDVLVEAGRLTTLSYAYEEIVLPPQITSAGTAEGSHGDPFSYQITTDNDTELYSLRGSLPAGLSFDPVAGLISGSLGESGVFAVILGASNTGGADSRELVITSYPVIGPVVLTVPYLEPMSYPVPSSESGGGLDWTATGLPAALSINPNTGVITGIPQVPGIYQGEISVTRKGATSRTTFVLTVTGIPPEITLQPDAERSIQYGTTVTLRVAATGLPTPELQWFEGPVGNTDRPVEGASGEVFTTPPLTTTTTYWVRASSLSGIANSTASLIRILPSSNANLIDLLTSEGELSPVFNLGITSYFASVPNEASALVLTPVVEVEQSTVLVQGIPVPPGGISEPVVLVEGNNLINIDVTSGDGSATKRYTLTVNRAAPPSVVTGPATDVGDSSVVLTGTINPNGSGTAFFQYGTTTDYGSATPGIEVSGALPLPVEAPLAGLAADASYHFRIGLTTGAGTIFGADMTFATTPAPPLVATGLPVSVVDTDARFIGAVDPNGTPTEVRFEWGESTAYGNLTPIEAIPATDGVVDVAFDVAGLVPGMTYHYRLVGTSAAGSAFGEDVSFVAGEPVGGAGAPLAAPDVTTLSAVAVTASSAVLQAEVNPQGGTTFVSFDYGLTPAYGQSTPPVGIGNGTDLSAVVRAVTGLLPGSTYHFRAVASNSLGTAYGEDRSFETGSSAPVAITGAASPVPTDRVRLQGRVRTGGANVAVFFDYGTDGVSFPHRVQAEPSAVGGDAEVDVSVTLDTLDPGATYYYRVAAVLTADPTVVGYGEVRSFSSAELAGLLQKFPRELDAAENQGRIQVNLLPAGIGAWRFVGEKEWHGSGGSVTGMTSGDREIEYQPVAGYLQPAREPVGIVSGEPQLVLEREYFPSASPATAGLKIILEPASRVAASPTSNRVQWRLLGGGDQGWKDSDTTLEEMVPGSYLIECKKVQGLDAPPPTAVVLKAGEVRTFTLAYLPNLEAPDGTLRFPSFTNVSTDRSRPYAYVGQLKSDMGSYSGFVVRPRVVATVAQALFDEATLAQVPGVQWRFQRDRDVHEPTPLMPRGFYLFEGYAAQRAADSTPGELSLDSQSLNVAALYFLREAGRSGYSGFWATTPSESPLLDGSTLKILAGFPMRGGTSTSNHGRMFAVEPAPGGFSAVGGGLFETSDVLGLTGMLGAPLCIQRDGGSYYPAAMYLGGNSSRNLVRTIDAPVIDLFNRAERTANTGENNTSGGISLTSYTAFSTTATQGSLTVILEPAEARLAGALWRLGPSSSYLLSGTRKNNLSPGNYQIEVTAVDGFNPIPPQVTAVVAGSLTTVTIIYEPELGELAAWREENFSTTANEGLAADSGDADGDNILNIDEYIAGTDPLDPNDFFKVASTQQSGGAFSADVQGRAGRIYTLQRSGSLGPDEWTNVASAGPMEADGPVTLSDTEAPADRAFYRVGVSLADP